MNKFITRLLFAMLAIPVSLYAAVDTVWVPNDGNLGTINTVIQGDTTASGARVNPDRWYGLHRGGYYLLNGWITVKTGTHIRIFGEDAPATGTDLGLPVIAPGAVTGVYYLQPFDCFGDLTLKNVWLFYVDNGGATYWNQLAFESDNLHGTFDHVIFDWDIAPAMHILAKHFVGRFTNCIFRNLIDPTQWWSGRQIYFESNSSGDTVWCENNTFENMGFVYQTQGIPVHRVYFNHNTFVNVSKFALQEVYWTWFVCTNNVFVNCHFTGERVTDRVGQDTDGLLYGAVLNVDTLNAPVDGVSEMQRVLIFENNSNFRNSWFQDWYTTYNDTVPPTAVDRWILPEPLMNARTAAFFDPSLFPHPNMKMANIYDGADPGFTVAPTNKDSILKFLTDEYGPGANTNWGFHYDLDAHWPLTEDLSYSNSTLKTAGMRGYPLGDLNWFPNQLATWKSEDDWAVISPLTAVNEQHSSVPAQYALHQNYPNPFNPTTEIEYSVPRAGYVSLKVYNVLGQEVATLFSGLRNAGTYQATFDAGRFASGVYFYRLQAGGLTITKKMVLMK
jgi:hypothetical protein